MKLRPPTGWTLVALVVAIAFLSGTIGWRVGQTEPRPATGSAQIGFLYDMIDHHAQAIHMSAIELAEGADRSVKVFAEEIHRFQSYETGLMERLLDERGHSRYDVPEQAMGWMGDPVARDEMPGLASVAEIDGLQHAGGDTDAWFVALMVDHHAAGVQMAEAAAEKTSDGDVRRIALQMAKAQRSEIDELLRAADRAGLDVPPPGVTWDVYGGEEMSHHG